MPVTTVKRVDDLPDFTDYAMKGRTYRFLEKEPLYPFGFGLSYTRFAYALREMPQELPAGGDLTFRASVTNTGERVSDAVLQVYLTDKAASVRVPVRQLVWFAREEAVAPGETRELTVTVPARAMAVVNEDGSCQVEPGAFTLSFGGVQPDAVSLRLSGGAAVTAEFTLTGDAAVPVPYI